jgi:serine/threonine-protein kinase HipA
MASEADTPKRAPEARRALDVYLNERQIGTLSEGADLWTFEYVSGWAQAADGFDLSPELQRSQAVHRDGATHRPVQWYFDNLLPEEGQRLAISKEARLSADDAFALLEYLGAESAGSLVLIPPGQTAAPRGGLRPLTDATLSERIRDLPRATLGSGAPKRMSVAGAQDKLAVVYREGELCEPVGGEPSTHILKPDHRHGDYPASVINLYFVMSLAAELKLRAPPVHRLYVPEPVYLIERFDRFADEFGQTQRRHIIDACQLLNKSRQFKHTGATLHTLAEVIACCTNKASTRLRLFQWLVFNVLVANDDNHLKNLSFLVSPAGIELAPTYDILSTSAWHTKAMAGARADWPAVEMAFPLPGARTFGEITRESLVAAGLELGLTRGIGERELDRMVRDMPGAIDRLLVAVMNRNKTYPEAVRPYLAGQVRLLDVIPHIIVRDMLERVRKG